MSFQAVCEAPAAEAGQQHSVLQARKALRVLALLSDLLLGLSALCEAIYCPRASASSLLMMSSTFNDPGSVVRMV